MASVSSTPTITPPKGNMLWGCHGDWFGSQEQSVCVRTRKISSVSLTSCVEHLWNIVLVWRYFDLSFVCKSTFIIIAVLVCVSVMNEQLHSWRVWTMESDWLRAHTEDFEVSINSVWNCKCLCCGQFVEMKPGFGWMDMWHVLMMTSPTGRRTGRSCGQCGQGHSKHTVSAERGIQWSCLPARYAAVYWLERWRGSGSGEGRPCHGGRTEREAPPEDGEWQTHTTSKYKNPNSKCGATGQLVWAGGGISFNWDL